ncbi:hypothetical protein RP20_CCG027403 [Aedes albopictus]|nr:hypothetical protein RP20_CCG027403 [Aedes albopictus]
MSIKLSILLFVVVLSASTLLCYGLPIPGPIAIDYVEPTVPTPTTTTVRTEVPFDPLRWFISKSGALFGRAMSRR